jgi:septal ring factor EnvC (AmiA/AmiB activator)
MAFKESRPIKDISLDGFTQDELKDNLIDKMNFRLTFLSVILPIVLILGLLFLYFVMNHKMTEKHNLALKQVNDVSKDIDELKTFFSEQTSESKKSLMDGIGGFSQTLNSIQKDIRKQAEALQKLKKEKTDKKAVDTIVNKELTGVTKALDTVQGDLKKQQKGITGLAKSRDGHEKTIKDLGNNLAALGKTLSDLKQALEKQESDIRNLSKTKADVKGLDRQQEQLSDKVQLLEIELRLLKKQIQSTDTSSVKSPLPTSPSSEKGPATKKEDIIEEEIVQ